ncbi:hypothetical protein PF005_g11338 [Phytophthora fragariae]|uniref:Uncharacterized protein n=1 Tax=Phytophthora fragariae TaxID=53985 RepID=A0A6A3XYX8_9STRA|nr:hypothetical protein PF007_g12061 [Phytophthora fragariae]KAE9210621.1 hypothetical protein PF005_g11338 [Phytophthora fragariae]KAE9307177.1 hypothetical protein PF001_g11747 [Phytophthora fragariae]
MVKWFFERFSGLEVPSEVATKAVGKGHLPVLRFLLEHDEGLDYRHEQVEVELEADSWTDSVPSDGVQWLLDNKCIKKYQIRSASTFLTLAREGKLDLMQQVARLHDKKRLTKDWIDKWDWAMEIAARLEDLSMVKWMAEHRYGREVLKRGKDDNVFVMTDIPRGAAKGGHIGGGWSTSLDKGGRMNTRLLW